MTSTNKTSSDVNVTPEIEHFLNLNTILHSLVDFIRPETFIAPDELQTYNELKDKFIRESTIKRSKNQQTKSSLPVADVQSIRSTSGIYQFLAHHHKNTRSTVNNKQNSVTSVSREELLKKLHEKMPHRQQQQTENGVDHTEKRKRIKEKSNEREKKHRITPKEWPTKVNDTSSSTNSKISTIPTQITFGRFEFNTGDSIETNSKKKKHPKEKFQTKHKKLINTLKKVETEENELKRLREENPEEGKEILRSKHWQTALAKAKGEKIRDNVQLLRKTIKKQTKIRQQSAKKWQKTKSETDKRMKERQDKRTTNLQKRKDDKKAKIKKRLIKKGRLIS